MATTGAQSKASQPAAAKAKETRLDNDVSMPGYVAPGDGPFDTTDPTEIATSVSPDKAAAAAKGFGVVNAVLPLETIPGYVKPADRAKITGQGDGDGGERTEEYDVVGPDGSLVRVTHNLETGETSV